ncbi:MAG: hypothetical protein IJ671_07880 [Succinivibrio sp.]|jgi:hypothetical protein|nr:hypothetical protein [Succinivibrio sp.]MBR1613432.1 hypothetical protein [Succinivibrio sp.]
MKISILAAGAVVFTMLLTGCGEKKAEDTPEKSAEVFTKCIYENDTDCVFNLFRFEGTALNHPEKAKDAISVLAKAASDEAKAHGGLKSVNVLAASYSHDRNRALVPVEVVFAKDDYKTSLNLNLSAGDNEDKNWYVLFE